MGHFLPYAAWKRTTAAAVRSDIRKGCDRVATKSILKSIHIKDRKQAAKLVSAMERAERQRPQRKADFNRMVSVADRDEVKLLFEGRGK